MAWSAQTQSVTHSPAEVTVALCTRTVFTTALSISANSTPSPLMMRNDMAMRNDPVRDTEEGT